MKPALYAINNVLLFAAVSIYFGTGWSTVLFQFPVMPELTPQNYALHFIPQIDAATDFFTFLVTLMLVTCGVMIWQEWRTRFRWLPLVLLVLIIGSTCLTVFIIFPVNDVLRAGITEQAELMAVVRRWMNLTWLRAILWSLEWSLMAYYFAMMAFIVRPSPTPVTQ